MITGRVWRLDDIGDIYVVRCLITFNTRLVRPPESPAAGSCDLFCTDATTNVDGNYSVYAALEWYIHLLFWNLVEAASGGRSRGENNLLD